MSLTVPISLLAHMTLATATSRPSPSASASAPGRIRPLGSTGSQVTSAPSCLTSHSTLSRTAWCSAGLTTSRRRRASASPPGPEQALDREVVALGAAAGEQHLRRPGAQRLGQPLAGLLGHPPGGPAAGVQRRRVAHPAELLGHRRQHLGQHRGRRRVVQVRHVAASVVAAVGATWPGGTVRPATRTPRSAGTDSTATAASTAGQQRAAAVRRPGHQHAGQADAQGRGGDVGDLEGRGVGAPLRLRRLVEQQHADARHAQAHAHAGDEPGQVRRPPAQRRDRARRRRHQADREQDEPGAQHALPGDVGPAALQLGGDHPADRAGGQRQPGGGRRSTRAAR